MSCILHLYMHDHGGDRDVRGFASLLAENLGRSMIGPNLKLTV